MPALTFESLRFRLAELLDYSPRLKQQLDGVDIASLNTRADLAAIPLLRKSDLPALQHEAPPFAGIATAPGAFKRLFMSPGPIFEAQDHGDDPFGAKPAFVAAGFVCGDIVLNCFSYHLTPGAFIIESGAHALGCAVIPAGAGNSEQTLQAVERLKPTAYAGPPDYLKILLDKADAAGVDASSIRKALVSGAALPPSLRAELEGRGVKTRQAFATAELGLVACETEDAPGMKVSEDVLLEIVKPGSGDPLPVGGVGEIVVTVLRGRFPVLRFATGDLSAFIDEHRIRGWMGRADQTTKVRGMFVHPSEIVEVGRRHPELGDLRLVVRRQGEQDEMVLRAEAASAPEGLADRVAATLQAVTKLRGQVELVAPGALPNDGKTISDERLV